MSSEPTESMSNSFDHASRHESGEPVSDKSSSNGEAKYTVEPIAIVGMSLKFPEASSEDEFWDILMQKRCVSKEFPRDRLNIDRYHSSDPGSTNKMSNRGGHFLDEDFRAFDSQFFSIPPLEAATMDPQQRRLLETTYRALENAGIPMESIKGSRTSVHVGSFTTDFQSMNWRDIEQIPRYSATGTAASILSNRISWFYDLKGSSVTVDTACSSGMVALDLSCAALLSGNSDMGIVAGSALMLSPEMNIALSNMNFLSPDSKCYSFDSRANGYARGEGFGVLILKRASKAIADGDHIRALIRATGTNQDGHTSGGVTQPSKESQVQLIRETYEKAGLDLKATRFFEAHGTGTAIGDPIEANAIGESFKDYTSHNEPLYVGAVKSNIGHLEGASGIAGIIKTVLVLEKGLIPPNANFETLNPNIDADSMNIKFPSEGTPWPSNSLRRASVNSFGFGGTNAHAVLEDASDYSLLMKSPKPVQLLEPSDSCPSAPNPNDNAEESGGWDIVSERSGNSIQDDQEINSGHIETGNVIVAKTQTNQLLVWSSAHEAGLTRLVEQYAARFSDTANEDSDLLHNLAFTLACRRSLLSWRSFVVTDSVSTLTDLSQSISKPVKLLEDPRLAFVFTGQGAQWCGMGFDLLVYPTFRQSLLKTQEYLQELGCTWLLLDELSKHDKTTRIHDAEFSQALSTAVQIGLVDLLRDFDVVPAVVVGHSSGEIAAAYCTRSLDHRSAVKVSYYRGLLASKLSSSEGERCGMAAVGLSCDQVYAKLDQIQPDFDWSSITVSCINSPKNVTLSGPEDKIAALISHLQDQHVFARKLLVKVGYHSPQMSAIASEYLNCIGTLQNDIEASSDKTTMISSVSCETVSANALIHGEYWVQNMVSPVNFLGALERCCASPKSMPTMLDGFTISVQTNTLVEIGPHSALQGPIRDILQSLGTDPEVTYTSPLIRNRSGTVTLLATMGQLHCRGIKLDLNKLNRLASPIPHSVQVMTDLPQYPFNHTIIHWDESNQSKELRIGDHIRNKLLGAPGPEWNILRPTWRLFIRSEDLDWVKDHKVDGSILYPAAGMLAMAIEATKKLASRNNSEVIGYKIKEVRFHTALVVPDTHKGVETQICLLPSSGAVDDKRAWYEFRIYSSKECDEQWTEHCNGFIRADVGKGSSDADFSNEAVCRRRQVIATYEDARPRCQIEVNKSKIYRIFRELGLDFGPCFQRLEQLFVSGSDESIGDIMIQSKPESQLVKDDHEIHPTTLDAVFQSVYVALSQGSAEGLQTMVPSRIGKLWLSSAGSDEATTSPTWQVYTKIEKLGQGGARGSIIALECQQLKVEVHDIEITTIPGSKRSFSDEKEDSRLAYGMTWKADLATMSFDQVQEHCESASVLDIEPIQWRQDLEFTALAFAHACLLELRRLRTSPSSPHLKKYLSWIEMQVERDLSANPEERLLDHEGGQDKSMLLTSACERLASSRMGETFVLVGNNLTKILLGEIDPLQLLFHDEHLIQGFYDEMNEVSRCLPSLANYLDLLLHKTPGIKILEIGAGTGATTKILHHVLAPQSESPRYGQYDFTDVSPSFFSKAKEHFQNDKLMNFCTLDIERDPSEQGFLAGTYDLVIAANVLHATKDLKRTLENVRKLLKPGGKLALFEVTVPTATLSGFVFGTLPGWWLSTEDWRQQSPCITEQKWDEVLKLNNFSGTDMVFRDFKSDECHGWSVMISTAVDCASPHSLLSKTNAIAVLDLASTLQQNIVEELDISLKGIGGTAFQKMNLHDAALLEDKSDKHFVFIYEIEHPLLRTASPQQFEDVKYLFSSSASILWVTAGGGRHLQSPDYGMVQGLRRVSQQENTKIALVTLALDPTSGSSSNKAKKIFSVFEPSLSGLKMDEYEPEYVEIDGKLNINRLTEDVGLNEHITRSTTTPRRTQNFGDGPPLRISMKGLGSLESLKFEEDTSYTDALGADEIEVKVAAVGVNFKECLTVLGRVATDRLGSECSGVVSRIGSNAANIDLKVGDRVVLLGLDTYRTYARTHYQCAIKIPDEMTFAEAAAIPTAFCTAWYSLIEVGRLQKDESILIHTASGGTGQAAVQLAMYLGANIFATVGSTSKKQLLIDKFNIPEEHIFFSRDTSFAGGIMRVTRDRGVDMVLNSLSGDSLVASWECIAPYGRFVEIGRKDIDSHGNLPMFPFIKNASFSGVDLTAITEQRPDLVRRMLQNIMSLVSAKSLRPADPLTIFSISDIEKAFRLLQSGKSSGKIVLEMDPLAGISTALKAKSTYTFSANATYVIAGGLGGLGRTVARWLVQRGAKHLLLLSRSGVQNNKRGQSLVSEFRTKGVQVETPVCDVSNLKELQTVISLCSTKMPPIKGCILSQMVIRDSPIDSMPYDVWNAVVTPKVEGSWNMHLTLPKGLDFFIMFSSINGIFGNTGQSNYAAGNTFQDGLAQYRISHEEKALSLDLGCIMEEGYLAEHSSIQEHLLRLGILIPMSTEELLAMLDYYCDPSFPTPDPTQAQIMTGLLPPAKIRAKGFDVASAMHQPLFRGMYQIDSAVKASSSGGDVSINYQNALATAESLEVAGLLIAKELRKKLCRVVGLNPEDLELNHRIESYGVDSLVSVELRNWFYKEIGADITTFEIVGSATFISVGLLAGDRSRFRRGQLTAK